MFPNHARLSAALLFPGLLLLWSSTLGQAPTLLPLPASGGTRGPSALLFRPDGKQLWVAEQDENDIALVDCDSGRTLAHLPSGGQQPCALAASPDGHALVVANTFSGSVGIVDVDKRTVRAKISLLGEPAGVAVTPDGRAWVSVSQLDQVAVIDIAGGKITRRIPVGHGPRVLALAPDGKTLVCANSLGGSLSLIDTDTNTERRRIALPAINLRGMAFTPDGAHVWVTGQQPHNELSTLRPETLWSNVLCEAGIRGQGSGVKEEKGAREKGKETGLERMLVLDRAEYGAADPCGLALDEKGETAYVTLSGTHEAAVVPLHEGRGQDSGVRGQEIQKEEGAKTKSIFRSDGGAIDPALPIIAVGAEVRRISVGCNPRALALRPRSGDVWIANHLGNSLTVLPPANLRNGANPEARVAEKAGNAPGGTGNASNGADKAPKEALQAGKAPEGAEKVSAELPAMRVVALDAPFPSPNRRLKGRFFFSSAHVSHGQFFSCESCHPNGGTDGLSWKFAHVKDGMDARNTKDLRGLLLMTSPYGWGGREDDFEVFVHDEVGGLLKTRKLQHPEVHALWDLVNETPLPANPYRNADGTMTASALRGKDLFTGQGGCANCHVGVMSGGTRKRENIGTTPKDITIDVPHLAGAYASAPYLHDGRAQTLEEIFTKYNPEHLHGNADSLTPEQLKDLLEYVKEL